MKGYIINTSLINNNNGIKSDSISYTIEAESPVEARDKATKDSEKIFANVGSNTIVIKIEEVLVDEKRGVFLNE